MLNYYPIINSSLSKRELSILLKKWEPWGHRIDFTNGLSTKDYKLRTPFSDNTLQKLSKVEEAIDLSKYKNATVLDIGCNSGYNSMYMTTNYDFKAVGIDNNRRHIEVSTFLSEVSDVDNNFFVSSAETFSRQNYFNVILHFGTLYHLPNPLLSLNVSFDNLKDGGVLAIETQVYDDPRDENLVYFMHMHNNDKTNFWALSTNVIIRYLKFIGFRTVKEIFRVKPKLLKDYDFMERVILIANK